MKDRATSANIFFGGLVFFLFATNFLKITHYLLEAFGIILVIFAICLFIYKLVGRNTKDSIG